MPRYQLTEPRISIPESQKDRETRWIEHKLRDIYQPILECKDNLGTLHTALQMNSPYLPVRLKDHLYLCDGKLRNLIKRFVEMPPEVENAGFKEMGNEIITYVQNTTDSMIERLHELNTTES